MKQKTIRTVLDALNGATRAIAGATEMGENGLKHQTAAVLTAARAALVTSRKNHDAARTLLSTRQEALRSSITSTRAFLYAARDLLKPVLGNKYSGAWDATGFVRSLRVPESVFGVKGVLELLAAYFTAHPDRQSTERNLTAARAQALFNAVAAAESAVNSQKAVTRALLDDRNAKFTALRDRLRGLVKELSNIMGPMDPRWFSFGLNMPGAKQTPEVPQNVTAVVVGSNAVAVKWDAAPRAEYYHVWVKVDGVDQELRPAGTASDPDFTVEPLPSNATIEVAVSALNSGGESGKSAMVTVTTHESSP